MYEKEGIITEHVPPQCLFPKDRDLPEGIRLRRNLITVPSCVEHNSKQCKDDEYLMYTLVLNLPTNGTAFQQFSTKVTRAIERNPSLIRRLLGKITHLIVEDTKTGERFPTIGYEVDTNRFYGALDKVARGLYFYHYRRQWLDPVHVRPEFLLSLNEPHSLQTNEATRKISKASDVLFSSSEAYGDNVDAFCYRVHEDAERGIVVMRLCFYGNGNVTVVFGLKRR